MRSKKQSANINYLQASISEFSLIIVYKNIEPIFLLLMMSLLGPLLILISVLFAQPQTQEKYVCLPCGQDCDLQEYDLPGKCSHCQMDLVKKSTVTFKTVTPAQICNYIDNHRGVVLLDVRTKEEFEGTSNPNFGTLKNAINIPIGEINKRIKELDQYKNNEIIVFCSHSHRSPQVSYLLSQKGFKKVSNMSGGMSVMSDPACKK
jgi:rhodanese-related sulfurtransferase